ncbi:hypothetical protein F4819DRAFT_483707 [Hypoxylon fuscum]|nr:hypothetical protein F4819DRAFT_483707 [Hypoxylon fuscum]
MCFGSKDKSDDPAPKPAQVPVQQASSSKPTASMPQDYAPPAGPPPSHGQSTTASYTHYAPPPGPPPSQGYVPPAGPPPSKNNPFFEAAPNNTPADYAPPSGPPPSHAHGEKQHQQPQHDWETAVPDTALLPPPPSFFSGFDRSPANNATEEEAEAGERWCAQYPLYPAMPPSAAAASAAQHGAIAVFSPPFFRGALAQAGAGVWRGRSEKNNTDTCLATYPPLYHAAAHSPLATGQPKTVYFEVQILEDGSSRREEVSLALGFAAPPYPAFRLPGWHRASLGVHGDDGHRYVNDRWGGKPFAAPFKRGETVGLGMRFAAGAPPSVGAGPAIGVEVFLTRDGQEAGRWNLHEETDQQQDLPVTGLEGYHDLCAAVGVFDKVAFEVVFAPGRWMWRG